MAIRRIFMLSPLGAAFALLGLITFSVPVAAQDCNALLAHGLRNVEVKYSSRAALATKYYRNCGLDVASLSDTVIGNVEVEVFGYGSGSGGLTRTQREDRLRRWCIQNKELAQSAQDDYVRSESTMAEAVSAWSHCNELANRGVQTRPVISPDQRTVSMNISFTGPVIKGSGVEFYGVKSENFDCDTRVPGMTPAQLEKAFNTATPVIITPAAIAVECRRPVKTKTVNGQQYTWLERGTITVQNAADPYQLFFVEQTDPLLPDAAAQRIESNIALLNRMLPPVGALVAFTLTPAEIAKLAPHWLPADGRVVNDAESPLHKRTLPDLRQRMLLGVAPDVDTTAASRVGGSRMDIPVEITGRTGWLIIGECSTQYEDDSRNHFNGQSLVWDTLQKEMGCQHYHELKDTYTLKELPWPPHREVVYLVRVR
jgi:hypothetical protein